MQQNVQPKAWFVGQWGVWGWVETIFKFIAAGAGFVSFAAALSADTFIIGGNPRLAATILTAFLSLAMLAVIPMRIQQREVISVVFAVVNALGHIGLLIGLLRLPEQTTLVLVFAAFQVFGQLAKLVFLRQTGFTESGQTTSGMMRFNVIFTGIYVMLAVFAIV